MLVPVALASLPNLIVYFASSVRKKSPNISDFFFVLTLGILMIIFRTLNKFINSNMKKVLKWLSIIPGAVCVGILRYL